MIQSTVLQVDLLKNCPKRPRLLLVVVLDLLSG